MHVLKAVFFVEFLALSNIFFLPITFLSMHFFAEATCTGANLGTASKFCGAFLNFFDAVRFFLRYRHSGQPAGSYTHRISFFACPENIFLLPFHLFRPP